MNANAVAKHYGALTAEERFCLILAAGDRGDKAEQDRLKNAGERITISMPDYSPYADAFGELAQMIFLELLEEAARYLDAIERADDARDTLADDEDGAELGNNPKGTEADADMAEKDAGAWRDGQSIWERYYRLTLAAGYMLKTKADGWKLFCEQLSIPPFAIWKCLPGFDRLQRALSLAEKIAFVPEGFLCWMNEVRPKGTPELSHVPLTAEAMADEAMRLFRASVAWWGGDG
jgi:hypothetical protein